MGSSGQSLILSQSAPLPSPQFAPKQLPTSRPTFQALAGDGAQVDRRHSSSETT
tara:strand:+ start:2010 stop:2171 length:162 start_codon:yes stop_codon:yes gene_type:complete